MTDENSLELAERERSHPERVYDFHAFTARLHELTGKSLIVAIDELDKIASGADALALVNGLKDLLHGIGTHVLVSVSEDALVSFALRGVPLRDAFDSSFDSIIPVSRFGPADSLALMSRRVVDFPEPLTLFCHAISGGLPRDLIRHARHCVEVSRRITEPTMARVIADVTRAHAMSLLDAVVARVRLDDRSAVRDYVDLRRRLDAASSRSLSTTLSSTAKRCTELGLATTGGDDVRAGLGVVLAVLKEALSYFGSDRSASSWSILIDSGAASDVAAALGDVVAAVSADADDARGLLDMRAASLGRR